MTVGVVGTVALAPTELKLSETDRTLLRDGMALRVEAGALKLNDDDRLLLRSGIRVSTDGSALYDPANHLNEAAERLFAAAERFGTLTFPPPPLPQPASAASVPITLTLDPALRGAMTELRNELVRLQQRIGGNTASNYPAAPDADLIGAINQLRLKIEAVEAELTKGSDLDKALGELKKAVDSIAPRRNVRGQEGGPR